MTALNCVIGTERIFVVADTSVATTADRIIGATTKVHALPHLRLVVAATGQLELLSRWIAFLLTEHRLRNVTDLNALAPGLLARLFANLNPNQHGLTDEAQPRSSVYHFGALADNTIVAFRYSSGAGFASERLAPGVYLHPGGLPAGAEVQPGVVVADELAPTGPAPPVAPLSWRLQTQACVSAMRLQHEAQRVPIGGRIQCCEITPDSIHQYWLGELGADPDA